ncbi:hypothetical protein H0H92_011081 [Tricholoma furcatifolium]|nr:hypothetical protein H0H92_011081 [Tricholoma furcatifolium]
MTKPTPYELYTIRSAIDDDLELITDLFNDKVLHSTALWIFETSTIQERKQWLDDCRCKGYAVLVAVEKATNEPVAYASQSSFLPNPGYNLTCEVSVYIHPDHHRRGLGRMLMREMHEIAKTMGLRTVIASISGENEASIRLFQALGYESVGVFKSCGYKFGRWLDMFTPFPWGSYTFKETELGTEHSEQRPS